MGVLNPNSKGDIEAWDSPTPIRGATQKRGNPYPQLKRPHRSVGVLNPNSRGYTELWKLLTPTQGALTPTQGATAKRGGPVPQLKGPKKSVESLTQSQTATTKRDISYPNLQSHKSMRVLSPNSRGPTEGWESLAHIEWAPWKRGSP